MLKHPETDHGTPLTTLDQVCVHNPKYGVVVDERQRHQLPHYQHTELTAARSHDAI